DLAFHLKSSLATLFWALVTVSLVRWAAWHARALWQQGLRALVPPASWTKNAGVLVAVALAGLWLYQGVLHPAVLAPKTGFVFSQVDEAQSGVSATLGHTLKPVDRPIAHVAKWLLSVAG